MTDKRIQQLREEKKDLERIYYMREPYKVKGKLQSRELLAKKIAEIEKVLQWEAACKRQQIENAKVNP